MKSLPGSGNYLVDAQDQEEIEELECGCKRRCRCDDGDEEGINE